MTYIYDEHIKTIPQGSVRTPGLPIILTCDLRGFLDRGSVGNGKNNN